LREKTKYIANKVLTAMHLPALAPGVHPARPLPCEPDVAGGEDGAGDDWLN
jgi:hypothetical protein